MAEYDIQQLFSQRKTGDSRDTWAVQLAEPVWLIGFHRNWYENQDIPQKAHLGKVSRLSQGWF